MGRWGYHYQSCSGSKINGQPYPVCCGSTVVSSRHSFHVMSVYRSPPPVTRWVEIHLKLNKNETPLSPGFVLICHQVWFVRLWIHLLSYLNLTKSPVCLTDTVHQWQSSSRQILFTIFNKGIHSITAATTGYIAHMGCHQSTHTHTTHTHPHTHTAGWGIRSDYMGFRGWRGRAPCLLWSQLHSWQLLCSHSAFLISHTVPPM